MIKRAVTMRKNWDGEDSGPEEGYLEFSTEDLEEESMNDKSDLEMRNHGMETKPTGFNAKYDYEY